MTNTTERSGYLLTGLIDWIVGIFAPCLALKRKRARAELKALEAKQEAETGGAQRIRDTGGTGSVRAWRWSPNVSLQGVT